jgi:hypothetical protein
LVFFVLFRGSQQVKKEPPSPSTESEESRLRRSSM